ncbi:hypothetical protein R5R35_013982 [Gryllus longicercus]|uniref:Uncharacterized protein n=1 Tax=Gryllus longicercus TaxID=2509291 RepID=A0AAN9V417_9ORTH
MRVAEQRATCPFDLDITERKLQGRHSGARHVRPGWTLDKDSTHREERGAEQRLLSKETRRQLTFLPLQRRTARAVAPPACRVQTKSFQESQARWWGALAASERKFQKFPGGLASARGGEAGVGEPSAAWSSLQAPARGGPPLRREHSGKGALGAAARGQRSGAVAAGIISCVMREQKSAVSCRTLLVGGEINTKHRRRGNGCTRAVCKRSPLLRVEFSENFKRAAARLLSILGVPAAR